MEKNNQLAICNQQSAISLPDNSQWTNRFEIKSETSNRLYVVAKNKKTGIWGCSCPGWITRRKCKHLFAIADMIAQIDMTGEYKNLI